MENKTFDQSPILNVFDGSRLSIVNVGKRGVRALGDYHCNTIL